ncbi:MAG: hypothetical protein M3Z75_26695, partial [Actinomycetota bacterium]|nr:hypothetical protein [Actinomycetota bacterium]
PDPASGNRLAPWPGPPSASASAYRYRAPGNLGGAVAGAACERDGVPTAIRSADQRAGLCQASAAG